MSITLILYKLRHSAEGKTYAPVKPEECEELLVYIEKLEVDVATLSVELAKLKRTERVADDEGFASGWSWAG